MKKTLLILTLFALTAVKAGATEWYSYEYEFEHFKYRADQLLGSEARVPEMFPVAVQLNDYVRDLQQSGRLKAKPVVYDLYTTVWRESDERRGRQRYLIEVYETDREYRINVNSREYFMLSFNLRELVRIIDWFASGSFEPFFCDTTMRRFNLSRELLFKKIDSVAPPTFFEKKEEYGVYDVGMWSIKMISGDFHIFWGGEKIDALLKHPIQKPVLMNDRLIVVSKDRFSVFEGAQCLKSLYVSFILEDEIQGMSNHNSHIKVYPQWLNIHTYDPDNARYSYSYAKNRFYELH